MRPSRQFSLIGGVVAQFQVLGPVEVRVGERVVPVGRPQQRLLMAALAVDAGRPVVIQALVDRLWDEAPAGARRTLHVLVTRLRRALELAGPPDAARVLRDAGGYLLAVDPDQVDLLRFRRLAAQAREPGTPAEERVQLLREAMGLWQGEPLSGLGGRWAERTRQALRQQHVEVAVAWAQAEVRAGDPAAVVGPLAELAGEHPLTESLTEALMRALYATGRPADALALYAGIQQRLADDLGTDPGPQLQAVHQQILRGQLEQRPAAGPQARAVPRQLPPAVTYFAGRSAELTALTERLRGRADSGPVVISAIDGTAGVGKTALAVYWAHRVADRFPDGQLYVNLRGFDLTGAAMAPAEAMRRFLDALGVPPNRIPADLDAQAALYRSELASRRMLIVLDNARDSAQVRQLLPGTASSLALVTSRNPLTGLVATDGAVPVTLDLLGRDEARQLLAQRLGAERLAADPQVVDEIVTRCAGLPLALAIVAARAAANPRLPLAALAATLRDTRDRLDALTTDEPATDLRAVFSWSYDALTPGAARLFRLLGLHPGPDIAASAAASLAGLPPVRVLAQLTELADANLVIEYTPGRYTAHDLLRAYAADLTRAVDPEPERHDATHRALDHYLHTAHAADRLLNPGREPVSLTPARPDVTPAVFADHQLALAWFDAEHPVLLAAVDHAASTGFDRHTWQLSVTIYDFLHRRGLWHDWAATQRTAVAAARRLGDPAAQARAQRNLGLAYIELGRLDDAQAQLQDTLDLYRRAGDLVGEGHTRLSLSYLSERLGDPATALGHAERALELYRAAGHRHGQANALNTVGWEHALLGDHERALAACEQALPLLTELGNRIGQAATWDSLGYAHHHLGHHAEAVGCYRQALDLVRELGDRYREAEVLDHLAVAHQAAGDTDAAREDWRRALVILEELDHPDADQVQARLRALDDPVGGH